MGYFKREAETQRALTLKKGLAQVVLGVKIPSYSFINYPIGNSSLIFQWVHSGGEAGAASMAWRPPKVPVGGVLIGPADAKCSRFVVGAADDL